MTRRHSSGGYSQVLRVRAGDAGVGDQDVDAAEARRPWRLPPPRPARTPTRRRAACDVAVRRELAAAVFAARSASQSQIETRGARIEEALGDGASEPLRPAGDDGPFPGEIVTDCTCRPGSCLGTGSTRHGNAHASLDRCG